MLTFPALESMSIGFVSGTLLDQLLNFIVQKQTITTLRFGGKVKAYKNMKKLISKNIAPPSIVLWNFLSKC